MKPIYVIIFYFLGFSFLNSYSQVATPGVPESFLIKTKQASIIPKKQLEYIDTAFLIMEDIKLGIANRYSVVQDLAVNIRESGIKTEISGKGYIWRYQLTSSDAHSLGLLFSSFHLPEGSRLFIYDESQTRILGAFTHINNKASNKLAIAELNAQNAIIEYFEPYQPQFEGSLILGSVSQAYRDMSSFLAAATSRVGINCPDGTEWQDEKHAVCRMTYQEGRYGYYCTGFLVNNVLLDGTPYFMTANHCINNGAVAATLVTYFNYENSTCTSGDASDVQTLSGSTLKSTSTVSDFSLLLLNEVPPVSYNAYLAGWDASTSTPQKGICIHHPSGTPKSISIDNNNPESYPYKINWDNTVTTLENTHWSVKFDIGNTESGSSGSPLFDADSRVIGQLHGGDDAESFYGKFSVSWDRNTLISAQLKAWLDPQNYGVKVLGGSYLKARPKSAFTSSYTNTCIHEVITLTDQSGNFPTSWFWKIEPASHVFVNGTTNTSRNPQVVFTDGGNYTATLVTSNFYGKDTLVVKNFVTVTKSIDVSFSGIPQDTVYCGYNLHTKPILLKGAHNYSYSIGSADKLTYTAKSDTLVLTVKENAKKYGSFNASIKVNGTMGTCYDTDSIKLHIVMPPNDYIANAARLWPGNNGGFSNLCGCAEEKEPMPPLISCISKDSWCPDLNNRSINSSIWFTFVGPANGKVTINTSGGDNRMAVYQAESYEDIISGNSALYTLVAANDNSPEGSVSAAIENLAVNHGRMYWLQVDSKAGTAGNVSISLLSNSLEVFPNPSNGKFDVIISSFDEGIAELKVYSSLGKQMLSRELDTSFSNNRFSFDLTGYPSGIYYLKVKIGDSTLTSKVMVVSN